VAAEIGSVCGPGSLGFARDLAAWQARHGLTPNGRMTDPTFAAIKAAWHQRRPLRGKLPVDACPPPPPPQLLQEATPLEGYGGKVVKLRPAVLEAYRRMREAARREEPAIARDPLALLLISGYRDPASDALRCAVEQNCDNRRRALCSAHRTGLVFDLYVGAAPGFSPTSTDFENRRAQSRSAAYRWMVRNAGRFGFVNYVYEPWHWEWTGPSEFGTPQSLAP
jgi:zinc D-Ala-D-Ala carboxypeptidase